MENFKNVCYIIPKYKLMQELILNMLSPGSARSITFYMFWSTLLANFFSPTQHLNFYTASLEQLLLVPTPLRTQALTSAAEQFSALLQPYNAHSFLSPIPLSSSDQIFHSTACAYFGKISLFNIVSLN